MGQIVNTTKADHSLQALLKNRTQKFGSFCSFTDQSPELSLPCQAQPVVDVRLMSARAIINTPREDREGDVIVPQGVQLDNYRKNPVVLWEHGLGEITRPIAKCQHADGELALEVTENEISAISFFTDKSLESLQIFHLIAEGLVRATSVRALPIKSAIRKTSHAGTGIILEEWELIEWSWGALGVNPDAIARTLDRGTIEGQKITQPLLKSLQATLPQEQITIPGWSKSNTPETSNGLADERSVETSHTPVPDQAEHESKVCKLKAGSLFPLGAQLLKSISASISELTERLNSTDQILENKRIQNYLKSFLQTLQNEQQGLTELYADVYRHLPPADEFLSTAANSAPRQFPDLPDIPSWLEQEQEPDAKTIAASSGQRQIIAEVLKELKYQNEDTAQISARRLERHVEELSQSLEVLQRKICDLLPIR